MTAFTQLTARLKDFLMDWLLVLGLGEALVECATLCVKSLVIQRYLDMIKNILSIQKKSKQNSKLLYHMNRMNDELENSGMILENKVLKKNNTNWPNFLKRKMPINKVMLF